MDKQITGSIGYIIQARMKSERLPGKVLLPLPLPDGEPLLGHIIRTIRLLDGVVIVATSVNKENDNIEAFCRQNEVHCYRGDEDNVLSRFLSIQKQYQFDHIVRLTADNPFVDSDVIRDVLTFHVENDNDYTSSRGLPLGMNIEVFRGNALEDSGSYVLTQQDEEHVTLVLKRETHYKKGEYQFRDQIGNFRLTVDTVQDFLVASAILQMGRTVGYSGVELIKYVEKCFPWIYSGNSDVFQKNAELSVERELQNAVLLLQKLEYFRVAELVTQVDKKI